MEKKFDSIAIGRRKEAVTRAYMKLGSGKFSVNGLSLTDYFPLAVMRTAVMQPLTVTKSEKRFDFVITVKGGGKMGQANAVKHALSRAILKYDDKSKEALKSASLLTRDPRMKERKKYGQKGARRRFQFSKR